MFNGNNESKNVCRATLVLETIKKTRGKGGMTASQIQLAEAQSQDIADMKQEIKGIKSDVSDVKKELSDVKNQLSYVVGKIDVLLSQSENKQFWQVMLELIQCKGFWIVVILVIIGMFGMNTDIIKTFLGG